MRPRRTCTVADALAELVTTLFVAGAVTCVLSALHRIAAALKLGARIRVLEEMGEAFTDEEREELVHAIKARSLSGL